MLITLKNKDLEISVDSFGAELHSIKKNGLEYLWQCGDAWKRYAPVLFPFICSPKDKKYTARGIEYTMPSNHGFARDSRFTLMVAAEDYASFTLSANDKTRKVYPYDFNLTLTYNITEDGVKVCARIFNKGEDDMYFYYGGHPAFNCPLEDGLSFDDYYIEYSRNEKIVQKTPDTERTVLEGNKLPLTRELFDYDVIMLDKPMSDSVTLKSDKSDRFVKLSYPEGGCIAVWSPTGNNDASFVCLEPWSSVPIYCDDEYAAIEEKPHAIRLAPGELYTYDYMITVG